MSSYPVRITFQYTSRDNEKTTRTASFDLYRVTGEEPLLYGYCELRHAPRTFNVEKMNHCRDSDTGQQIDDVREYLKRKFLGTPLYAISEFEDVVKCLIFIGRADGMLKKAENDVIVHTLKEIVPFADNDTISYFIDLTDDPSVSSFRKAVRKIAKLDRRIIELFVAASKRIIDTDKKVDPIERGVLEFIEQTLKL